MPNWWLNSLREEVLLPGAAILIAGAGTGQMFDYRRIRRSWRAHRTTFTDINREYLLRLASRVDGIPFETVVDDVESSALAGPFDLAIAVLVLEHVAWRRAVRSLCRLARRVFVVIQEDPPDMVLRPLLGTMAVLREAPPRLVPRAEVGGGVFAAWLLAALRADPRSGGWKTNGRNLVRVLTRAQAGTVEALVSIQPFRTSKIPG